LLREVFLRVLRLSPLLKSQHFQTPIRSGTHGHVSTSPYELLSDPWVNKLQYNLQSFSPTKFLALIVSIWPKEYSFCFAELGQNTERVMLTVVATLVLLEFSIMIEFEIKENEIQTKDKLSHTKKIKMKTEIHQQKS